MDDPIRVNTRQLTELELDQASGSWGFAFLIQMLMVFLSLFFAFSGGDYIWSPVITALMALASSISRWLSDRHKDVAEGLRRAVEEHECFGWSCSGPLRADLLETATPAMVSKAEDPDRPDPTHSVRNPLVPESAVELVEQSAWWAKRLASEMGYLIAGFAAVATSVALVTLLAALQDLNAEAAGAEAKLALAIIVIISCSGVFRLAADHYAFSAASLRMQTLAATLLARGSVSRVTAIRLLHQFQALRQQAPLVPTFWLAARKDGLRREWNQERRRRVAMS